MRGRKILLFDNGRLSQDNNKAVFDTIEKKLIEIEYVGEIIKVIKNVMVEDLESILEPFKTAKPDAAIIGLCDAGKISVLTILKSVYHSERLGIPTVLLTTEGITHLCAIMLAPLIPSFALCELKGPIWCLSPTVIKKKTEEIIPKILIKNI